MSEEWFETLCRNCNDGKDPTLTKGKCTFKCPKCLNVFAVFKRAPTFEESAKKLAESLGISKEDATALKLNILCKVMDIVSESKKVKND